MRILIIEDAPDVRQTLKDMLEINGHEVWTAADGVEGVELAARRPDFIFCDVAMPRMNGYATIEAVRNIPEMRDVPFVFLTARAEKADQRSGMALGADDYIAKPFMESDILGAITARTKRRQTVCERIEAMRSQRRQEIHAEWSHELLTPLNAMLGCLDLLEEEADTIDRAELKEVLANLRAGAVRQEHLSQKLIRYFELEQLRDASRPMALVSCAAATAVRDGATRAARESGRSADVSIEVEPGTVALCSEHLSYALAEVVANACRFSNAGDPVRVAGLAEGAVYRIAVLDCGPGMTAGQRASIGAFVQFDRKVREQQGLGLGLAIARATAMLCGGRFLLEEGEQNRGLKAVFALPLLQEAG